MNKIILHGNPEDFDKNICMIRAVKSLIDKNYDDCVFGYGDFYVWVKKNKASITARPC